MNFLKTSTIFITSIIAGVFLHLLNEITPVGRFVLYLVTAMVFISLGHLVKKHILKTHSSSYITAIILFFIVMLSSLLFPSAIGRVKWYMFVPFVICALCGTKMLYDLSFMIKKNKMVRDFLKVAGDNSFTILTWHFLCFKIVNLIIIYLYNLPIEYLAYFPRISDYSIKGWWLIYSLVGVFVPLCINVLIYHIREYRIIR